MIIQMNEMRSNSYSEKKVRLFKSRRGDLDTKSTNSSTKAIMMIQKIQVRDNSYEGKKVKQIEMFMGDLIFRTDVKSDRDINLAKRLARDSELELLRLDLPQSAATKILPVPVSFELMPDSIFNDALEIHNKYLIANPLERVTHNTILTPFSRAMKSLGFAAAPTYDSPKFRTCVHDDCESRYAHLYVKDDVQYIACPHCKRISKA